MAGGSPGKSQEAERQLGGTCATAPQTPTKEPRVDKIDELVSRLRKEFDLVIRSRDHDWSPAKQINGHGDKLYKAVQALYWSDRDVLSGEINGFRTKYKGRLDLSTPLKRTAELGERLGRLVHDAVDARKERRSAVPSPPFAMPARASNTALGFSLSSAAPKNKPALLRDTLNKSSTSLSSTDTSFSAKSSMISTRTANTSFTTADSFGSGGAGQDSQETVDDSASSYGPSSWMEHLDNDLATLSTATAVRSVANGVHDANGVHETYPRGRAKRHSSEDHGWASEDHDSERAFKRRRSDQDESALSPDADADGLLPTPPVTRRVSAESPGYSSEKLSHKQDRTVNYRIRDLTCNGFGIDKYPGYDEKKSYTANVERTRALQHIDAHAPDRYGDISRRIARTADREELAHVLAKESISRFSHSDAVIWDCGSSRSAELTLSGTITLNPKSDTHPLFRCTFNRITSSGDSCRVRRRFGGDRVLQITVPDLSERHVPDYLRGQADNLNIAFEQWLQTPHHYMGRIWRAFHLEERKKKVGGKSVVDPAKKYQIRFFAIKGDGITAEDELPLNEFFNWMLPLRENQHQGIHKAFTRVDLMVSANKATASFQAHQVKLGATHEGFDDVESDQTGYEVTDFDDPCFDSIDGYFKGMKVKEFTEPEIMTDGCGPITVGKALQICRQHGITSRPAVFQGRSNGSKGMWHIDEAYETYTGSDSAEHHGITIRKSQLKVIPRDSDFGDRCEADRWSFDVNSWSHALKPSEVHRDFLSILEDRGVPRSVLADIIRDSLELHVSEIRLALKHYVAFTLWRYKHFGYEDDMVSIKTDGLPRSASLKAQILCEEAGYLPQQCLLLAEAFIRMVEMQLQRVRKHIKAFCLKSTVAVGIADPSKLLQPGEVFLSLSQPLVNEATGECFDSFLGREVLVTRHPTLRGSDIQKVRCVYYPELAHLKDVLVMSVHGHMPLAGKLQGGDYDGDKFWVCAEERLTRPFLNAPILAQSGPEAFGIVKEEKKLYEIEGELGSEDFVNRWLREVFKFKLQPDMVGTITNHVHALSYQDRSLWSKDVLARTDLHDLMLDAAKNGYRYSEALYNEYHRSLGRQELTTPEYIKNINAMKSSVDENSKTTLLKVVSQRMKLGEDSHIQDAMLFGIINPMIKAVLNDIHDELDPAFKLKTDPDLSWPLDTFADCMPFRGLDFNYEISTLTRNVGKVFGKYWLPIWKSSGAGKTQDREERLAVCRQQYNAIQPEDPSNTFWAERPASDAPTNWERFKVAVIAGRKFDTYQRFLFYVATETVCFLKKHTKSGRKVVKEISAIKKPKKPKGMMLTHERHWEALDAGSGDEFDALLTDEDFDDLEEPWATS